MIRWWLAISGSFKLPLIFVSAGALTCQDCVKIDPADEEDLHVASLLERELGFGDFHELKCVLNATNVVIDRHHVIEHGNNSKLLASTRIFPNFWDPFSRLFSVFSNFEIRDSNWKLRSISPHEWKFDNSVRSCEYPVWGIHTLHWTFLSWIRRPHVKLIWWRHLVSREQKTKTKTFTEQVSLKFEKLIIFHHLIWLTIKYCQTWKQVNQQIPNFIGNLLRLWKSSLLISSSYLSLLCHATSCYIIIR